MSPLYFCLSLVNSMLISQLLNQKEEESYALQYASDTLSFAEDLPIRIFDIEAIKLIPEHFQALVQNSKYQQLYMENGHKNPLSKDIKGINSAELFGAFITRHAETVEQLFDEIMEQFSEHLNIDVEMIVQSWPLNKKLKSFIPYSDLESSVILK